MNIRPYKPPDRGYYFKFLSTDIKLIRYTLEDNGFREAGARNNEWTIMWACGSLKSGVYQGLSKYQKVNHFPRSSELTRKDSMYKLLACMQELHGKRHFNFVPKTFILPNELSYLQDEMQKDRSQQWIVKPSASA